MLHDTSKGNCGDQCEWDDVSLSSECFRKITGEMQHQMPRGRMNLINTSSVRKGPAQSGFTGEWFIPHWGFCRVAYGRIRPEEQRALNYSGVARPQPLLRFVYR